MSNLYTDIKQLLEGYRLCAATEGKSPNAIEIVVNSVGYFYDFLLNENLTSDATRINQSHLRAFILYLQQKKCFSGHRFNHAQEKGQVQNHESYVSKWYSL
ncbi:MAG: hypothetical protein NTV30_07935 [Chloroflexi bacterium]|nr:hypothetical protein [Chloroflexota bacterium]